MTDFAGLIRALADGGVECILIGGVAATIHGSARLTRDVDVVYSRRPDNLARMVAALGAFEPYLRGAPRGLPFHWDDDTVARGLNFTLTTTLRRHRPVRRDNGRRRLRRAEAARASRPHLRPRRALPRPADVDPREARRGAAARPRGARRARGHRRRDRPLSRCRDTRPGAKPGVDRALRTIGRRRLTPSASSAARRARAHPASSPAAASAAACAAAADRASRRDTRTSRS